MQKGTRMSLDQAMKKLKFDSRLIEQNLNTGLLTKEEHEAYLKSLPDLSVQAIALNMEDDNETDLSTH